MQEASIIIPAFNAAEHILYCIDSILKYSKGYKLEIIVVDDGSTDNTRKVLLPLIESRQIEYCYQENKGAAAARNKGIQTASGRYIGFLDADDVFLEDMIPECISCLQGSEFDLVSVDNYTVYYDNNQELKRELQTYNWIEAEPKDLFCTFLKIGGVGGLHKAFFKRTVFERVGLLDSTLPVYEDLDFWIRIAWHGLKWKHIRKPLLEYNHRGLGSSLFTYSAKRNLHCRLRILKRYKKQAFKICPDFRQYYAALLWDFGREYIMNFRLLNQGSRCLLESLIADPSLKRVYSSLASRISAKTSS